MPKPTNTAAVAILVTSMAEIQALKQTERIARFGERATVAQRAFAEMGKLRRAIEADLKPNQDITNTLRKAGVRDGTISNTSYAARVFDLVEAGHIIEAEYDTFTFADCLAICRAMGSQSKLRLGGPEVAVIIRESKKDFDQELACIYEYGMTVADHQAAEAKANAAREAAANTATETTSPGPSQAQPPPASTPAPAPEAETPPNIVHSGITHKNAEANGAETPSITGTTATPAPAPSGKPSQSKLQQTLNLIDALELMFADLPIEEARTAFPRLAELHNVVSEYVGTPEVVKPATTAAAKPAKKPAARKHAKAA